MYSGQWWHRSSTCPSWLDPPRLRQRALDVNRRPRTTDAGKAFSCSNRSVRPSEPQFIVVPLAGLRRRSGDVAGRIRTCSNPLQRNRLISPQPSQILVIQHDNLNSKFLARLHDNPRDCKEFRRKGTPEWHIQQRLCSGANPRINVG